MKYKIREGFLPTQNESAAYEFYGTDCIKKSFETLIEQGVQYHSTFTKADLLSAFNLVFYLIKKNITDGYSVSTPIGIIEPVITGTAKGFSDSFKPEKKNNNHRVKVNLKPDKTFIKQLQQEFHISRAKDFSPKYYPFISAICKVNPDASYKADSEFNKNDIVLIKGKYLKINPADKKQYLTLKKADVSYNVTTLIQNSSTSLVFKIPDDIESGTYTVELKNIPARKNYYTCTYKEKITLL